jgi:hypothetical protein
MTFDEILKYEYKFRGVDACNLREYFFRLLETLWLEGEGFSGKRPFGDSCWEYDIYEALVEMGAIQGVFDCDKESGERYGLAQVDTKKGNEVVQDLIEYVFFRKDKN